jgi:hypothetical protein
MVRRSRLEDNFARRELELLTRAGIPPLEGLRIAT